MDKTSAKIIKARYDERSSSPEIIVILENAPMTPMFSAGSREEAEIIIPSMLELIYKRKGLGVIVCKTEGESAWCVIPIPLAMDALKASGVLDVC